MAFFHRTLTVGGCWLTEAIGIKATTPAQPVLQLLIIPGNPGLCSFYEAFIRSLHDIFKGTADVWAISNLGHDGQDLSKGQVWCLDTQVQHKAALLREHVLAPGNPPAVIIAHSIGCYMLLHALKRLSQEAAGEQQAARLRTQIPKVMLLMPFLATDWSSKRQRVLSVAARCAPVLGAAAGLAGRLPTWLQDRLIGLSQPGAEEFVRRGIKSLLNRNGAKNNFHLAMHEFRDLDGPPDWGLIRRLGNQVAVVCAPDDMWWPMHHYEQLQQEVPGVEEYFGKELEHGFCCSTSQSQLVARLVHQSASKALAPAGAEGQGPDMRVLLADATGAVADADDVGKADGDLQHQGGKQQQQQQGQERRPRLLSSL